MKKVLHIITGLRRGGTESKLLRLCIRSLNKWEHHIVSLGPEEGLFEEYRAAGLHVTALGLSPNLSAIYQIFNKRSIVEALKPDLIFGWMYHGAFAAELFAYRTQIPTVWSVHHALQALDTERFHTRCLIKLLARMSSRPKVVVYCSRAGMAQHQGQGFNPKNGRLIQTGHDISRFYYSPAIRDEVRSELGIRPDQFVVGIFGRLHDTKGFRFFFEAIQSCAPSCPRLTVIGVGRNLTLEAIKQSGFPLSGEVSYHLLDERRDIQRFYSACDLVVSSSVGEALPSVIAEAMATERPCIVTDVGDSAELVGETGTVVPPRDTAALSRAIQAVYNQNMSSREEQGKLARDRVSTVFSEDLYVARHTRLWSEVVSAAPE